MPAVVCSCRRRAHLGRLGAELVGQISGPRVAQEPLDPSECLCAARTRLSRSNCCARHSPTCRGQEPVPATSPCSLEVTFTHASGTVGLPDSHITVLDEFGHLHHLRITTLSGGRLPAQIQPRQTVTLVMSCPADRRRHPERHPAARAAPSRGPYAAGPAPPPGRAHHESWCPPAADGRDNFTNCCPKILGAIFIHEPAGRFWTHC
jgi:hypothetical protein